MANYTVHFSQIVGISVRVEADNYEAAIEAAWDQSPTGVCAPCAGWGQNWSRDDDSALEPESVSDEDACLEVWAEPTRWKRVPLHGDR